MDMKKFLTGTLVGGIAFFFLGYLFYGVALAGFFSSHYATTATMKSMDDIVWWALILGNVSSGALLTYIFVKWANVASFGPGASAAATVGFFILSAETLRINGVLRSEVKRSQKQADDLNEEVQGLKAGTENATVLNRLRAGETPPCPSRMRDSERRGDSEFRISARPSRAGNERPATPTVAHFPPNANPRL